MFDWLNLTPTGAVILGIVLCAIAFVLFGILIWFLIKVFKTTKEIDKEGQDELNDAIKEDKKSRKEDKKDEEAKSQFEEIKDEKEEIISNNRYIKQLKDCDADHKDYYVQIKNHLLSYIELNNTLINDAETFKLDNRVVALITVKNEKLTVYIKISKAELDQRYNNEPTQYTKYKNTPMVFDIEKEVDVRKAIASIDKIADELELVQSKSYKSIGFGWLIKF